MVVRNGREGGVFGVVENLKGERDCSMCYGHH